MKGVSDPVRGKAKTNTGILHCVQDDGIAGNGVLHYVQDDGIKGGGWGALIRHGFENDG
jgi:hypothetical protein